MLNKDFMPAYKPSIATMILFYESVLVHIGYKQTNAFRRY